MTLTADMEAENSLRLNHLCFQDHGGMDIFNLLGSTEESDGDQRWTPNDTLSPESSGVDDFLDTLLHDSSSVPASPLWSPCTADSGVNEDPLAKLTDSPHPISCTGFPAFDIRVFPQPPDMENSPAAKEKLPDVSIDLGWESEGCQEEFGITCYLSNSQTPLLPSRHALTVKDLLLSSLGQNAQRISQQSLQELVLNEDEKKLLAKEGISLPCKLPLSKFEERILKKIRRKIRNKRSAQESRKKKREYVDRLEGRLRRAFQSLTMQAASQQIRQMTACSAQNLELQRKIQKLEETNNALLEQLSRLQALLPNSSCKTTNRGTCILVLLLCFSMLISSNIQPVPYSQRSHAEYTRTAASSRSLLSTGEAGEVRPQTFSLSSASWGFEDLRSLKEKLWAWTVVSTVRLRSPRQQEHNNGDDYGPWQSRNM